MMNRAKYLLLIVSIFLSPWAQARQNVCVFDLLGKAGESYKLMEEWALASKAWGADVNLTVYQSEEMVDKNFKTNKCDAAAMTTMRSREYNKFGGSIDALGGVPNNAIAQKAITFALDKRNAKRLISEKNGVKYELAAITPIGIAYIFVRDRSMNTLEKGKGKKFAYLHYDVAQKIAVERVGSIGVPSDIFNFVKKFNDGEVDAIASPAYAYKPLEIYKGLATNGAMFTYPVVNVTADLIIKPDQFPDGFGMKSREWSVKQLTSSFKKIEKMEAEIPAKYKLNVTKDDALRYQKLLRDGRIELTKRGIYDPIMMSVLKRARCTVDRTNFECSLAGE
ncbi:MULTISPECIES: putative solute-binding protein [unclassified Acinetobacter]|uniref:putative solute-binding protein n=1 Tax=Acinetobacter TaxID=469 RepID=UPI0018A8BA4B|nr:MULTISPECIES: putative solute-binding protein [unclassified Acinetobacter]MBJ9955216.1 RND transporter [Acinetobacter baumannii]